MEISPIKAKIQEKTPFTGLIAGVLSIKKDQKAKDGRTYHVFEITDGEANGKLYFWAPTCNFKPKTFIRIDGEVVTAAVPFFSAKEFCVSEVDKEDIPENSPLRNIKFRYSVDPQVLLDKIDYIANTLVQDINFRTLIKNLLTPKIIERLKDVPAGKSAHHSLEGGLLQHIYEMLDIYESLAHTVVCEKLRHEFVIIGILLHDIAKEKEYENIDGEFKPTNKSSLLGHIFLGAYFLKHCFAAAVAEGCVFSEEDMDKAVHVLLAHHGELEWGSPVKPAIPEAIVLHYIDQLSAKLNMFSTTPDMEFNKFLGTYVVK